jgi:hypothetical protein
MNRPVRLGAGVALLLVATACRDSAPTAPTGTNPSSTPTVTVSSPIPTPPTNFPPLSGAARTFLFERADRQIADYTKNSRFVLYDNGAFALQYLNLGGQYRGSYTEANGQIKFTWEACCGWDATANLEGDSLKVQYGLGMQMSDFEDAVYARMR